MTKTRRRQTWSPTNLAGARLGIYARASDDSEDTKSSVEAQGKLGERWAGENGVLIAERYCDNDKSASWYATKERTDFERMLRDIAAGNLDLIWFWALNRSQRRLDVYAKLRDLCRKHGVGWVIRNKLYDLNNSADLRSLGIDAVNGEIASLEISENVRLGMELAASRGKPHGPRTYGFHRVYDGRGRYVRQEPHPDEAPVVVEIITRIAKGEPITRLLREFEERGILSPSGRPKWPHSTLRGIAINKAYIGIRVHEPKGGGERTETPDAWSPISDAPDFPELFYSACSILASESRKTTRPGGTKHLLSYIARCECGQRLAGRYDKRGSGGPRRVYDCRERCSLITADDLDAYVREAVDAYLARDDVQRMLAAAIDDDAEAITARAEIARLNAELEENQQAREAGELSLAEYLRFKKSIISKLEAAQSQAEDASTPPLLRPGAVNWDDIPVARQIVGQVVAITLHPVGRGRRHIPIQQRVTLRPLLGPDSL